MLASPDSHQKGIKTWQKCHPGPSVCVQSPHTTPSRPARVCSSPGGRAARGPGAERGHCPAGVSPRPRLLVTNIDRWSDGGCRHGDGASRESAQNSATIDGHNFHSLPVRTVSFQSGRRFVQKHKSFSIL
ncbi:hypothetical protein BaRGS_00003138 [Batillaria attramentaria]|uniref:Uncharacterized protein n=1 Tax=Batillaria attramentaria TaxID=370345 RepID=A0ABD0M2N1_9CAEN